MSVLECLINDLKCYFCHYIDDAAQIAICLTVDPKRPVFVTSFNFKAINS